MTAQDKLPGMPDEDLLEDLEGVEQEARRRRAAVLAAEKVIGPGPVYQGVGKTIRFVTATGKYRELEQRIDPDEHAGVIAAARAAARTVDRMTGHNLTGWHANGRDLAPLLEQLRLLVTALTGGDPGDDLLAWLNDDDAPKERAADERAVPQPHRQV